MVFLLKKAVTTRVKLFNDTRATLCSSEGHADFFEIVSGVLQRDSTMYVYNLEDYILRTSIDLIKEKYLLAKKEKKQTISCRNYDKRRLRR